MIIALLIPLPVYASVFRHHPVMLLIVCTSSLLCGKKSHKDSGDPFLRIYYSNKVGMLFVYVNQLLGYLGFRFRSFCLLCTVEMSCF